MQSIKYTYFVQFINHLEWKTVKQKKIHKLFRVSEKQRAQKLLNAARFFKDCVCTKTAVMHEPKDVFLQQIFTITLIVVKSILTNITLKLK
jgi:hypothetical protein